MDLRQEINNAITAHGLWRAHLQEAIDDGTSEYSPAIIATDDHCDFGKWLQKEISPELKNSPSYSDIVKQHAAFHKEAAKILELALAGDKHAAMARMDSLSEFLSLSASLIVGLIALKKSLD
ncbi:MAG: CZB domain-containing protein [bacterium]